MAKIVDLKSLGISQDIKELKGNGTRKESYYNQNYEKNKLTLMQENFENKYNQKISKEKIKVSSILNEYHKKKLNEEEEINKQKQKVYNHSFIGRAKKGIGKLTNKIKKFGNERALNRQVVKKSNVTVKASAFNTPVENVFEDENRFFKGEMAKEKRSMFFS